MTNKPKTFATVCSGIEAPAVAVQPLGWKQVFRSEIEAFPNAVAEARFPGVPNYGDMTKYENWPAARVDVLIAGTPCQAFSVAGLREGLADPRGNLTLTFLGIVAKYAPTYVLWENVPGVLSDKTGAFGAFLGGLAQLGYGFAYAILDAQHFGVPQRRRRVFVVGHIGGRWERAAAVLFDRESLLGHPPPRRQARQGATAGVAPSIGASGRGFSRAGETRGQDPVVAEPMTLAIRGRGDSHDLETRQDRTANAILTPNGGRGGIGVGAVGIPEVAGTLTKEYASNGGKTAGNNGGVIAGQVIPINMQAAAKNGKRSPNRLGVGKAGDPAPTVNASDQHAVAIASTLRSCSSTEAGHQTRAGDKDENLVCSTVSSKWAKGTGGPSGDEAQNLTREGMAVRRLTPRECERLQGFTTCTERFTIAGCFDRQANLVHVEIKSVILPNNAYLVDGVEKCDCVSNADVNLRNDQESRGATVHAHVRISHEAKLQGLRNHGKCLLCANGVIQSSTSRRRIQQGGFALDIAAVAEKLASLTIIGKVESQKPALCFTIPLNGKQHAEIFGQSIVEPVKNAARNQTEEIKSTTSKHTTNFQSSDWTEETLCCFVLNAIDGFIPGLTNQGDSFTLVLDLESDFTLVNHRGKPAKDGPRYKALGNSMARPVIYWICERIDLVDELVPLGKENL